MLNDKLFDLDICATNIATTSQNINFLTNHIVDSYNSTLTNVDDMAIEYKNIEGFALILFDYAGQLIKHSEQLDSLLTSYFHDVYKNEEQ